MIITITGTVAADGMVTMHGIITRIIIITVDAIGSEADMHWEYKDDNCEDLFY